MPSAPELMAPWLSMVVAAVVPAFEVLRTLMPSSVEWIAAWLVNVAAPEPAVTRARMPWRFILPAPVPTGCPMVTPAWTVTVVVDAPVRSWMIRMPLFSSVPEFALLARWRMATRLAVALAPPTVSASPPPAAPSLSRVMPFDARVAPAPEVTIHAVEPPGTTTVATLFAPGAAFW